MLARVEVFFLITNLEIKQNIELKIVLITRCLIINYQPFTYEVAAENLHTVFSGLQTHLHLMSGP